MMGKTVCAVVTTYNRKDLLMECLNTFRSQTYPPSAVYIIDNASTDGTPSLLNKNGYIKELPPKNINTPWKSSLEIENSMNKKQLKVVYVRMHKNTGGSGGFYEGMKRAVEDGYDWIWVSDDDAFLDDDVFLNFKKSISILDEKGEIRNTAAICGSVINKENHYVDRARIHKGFFLIKGTLVKSEEYVKQYFEIDLFSYVGTFLNSKFLKIAGFTKRELFIYNDDTEHSLRLRKYGKIFCFPNIKVYHSTPANGSISWKTFYALRNQLLMIKWHFPIRYFVFMSVYMKFRALAAKFVKRDFYHKIYYQMVCKAVKDAKKEKMGEDEIYKPGWRP